MHIKYITEPIEQYVTRMKTAGMKHARTTIHCPLCKAPFTKRSFEDHVYKEHAMRVDECFARLFGLPWPAKCACGHDLRYSRHNKGFPVTCGSCTTGAITGVDYKSAADAEKHAEQLAAMLAEAKEKARLLKKEEELDKIPLEQLPFPTGKYAKYMRRLSKMIRCYTINSERDRVYEILNAIDKKLDEQ